MVDRDSRLRARRMGWIVRQVGPWLVSALVILALMWFLDSWHSQSVWFLIAVIVVIFAYLLGAFCWGAARRISRSYLHDREQTAEALMTTALVSVILGLTVVRVDRDLLGNSGSVEYAPRRRRDFGSPAERMQHDLTWLAVLLLNSRASEDSRITAAIQRRHRSLLTYRSDVDWFIEAGRIADEAAATIPEDLLKDLAAELLQAGSVPGVQLHSLSVGSYVFSDEK